MKHLLLIAILPCLASAFPKGTQRFINTYQLVTGDNSCAPSITIEARKDWQGVDFLGLNENQQGRGLQCVFKNIDQPMNVKKELCPTPGAGTFLPCQTITHSISLFFNKNRTESSLLSYVRQSTFRSGALSGEYISECKVTLSAGKLRYQKRSRGNLSVNRDCSYVAP